MSTVEGAIKTLDERQSVTTISANARIDYILKFSKHAVLVIDDDPDIYTNIGNSFLGTLSREHNAAFVSISSKLNDIQIRCRIIEQLFGNTLFDPEQPLSVNVVKLAEAKNEAITIVIANVESLSLQLTHELCQLAEIAKKLNKTINVLLLGKTQAAINLSENKHLFDNKVSVLLASSGQLISLSSSYLKNKIGKFRLSRNIAITFLILVTTILAGIFFTSEYYISSKDKITEAALSKDEYKKAFVQSNNSNEELTAKVLSPSIATSEEVFDFLITQPTVTEPTPTEVNALKQSITATSNINKLPSKLTTEPKIQIKPIKKVTVTSQTADANSSVNLVKRSVPSAIGNEAYYQNISKGFVIQLASFEKLEGFMSFIQSNKSNTLYGYTRRLNGVVSYIVTSKVYQEKLEAKNEINNLSQELRGRGPWIKSIQSVNNEINLYQQSR